MNVYVTTFDSGYLSRAIVLARSFAAHCPGERLYLCCMDDAAYAACRDLALPNAVAVAHDAFAPADLAGLRAERSAGEYCWTAKPFIVEHILAAEPEAGWGVYLDTDTMTFGRLSTPLDAHPELDAVFTPHNLAPPFASEGAVVGRFNAGYAAFRNSDRGREALAEWKRRCVASCSYVPSEGRFGDQKYLDDLAENWRCEIHPPLPGLNAAPWNIGNYAVSEGAGNVLVEGHPLLLYHFQGLKVLRSGLIDLYVGPYKLPDAARRLIYRPYAARLVAAERLVAERFPRLAASRPRRLHWREVARTARRTVRGFGNLMLVPGGGPVSAG